MLRYFHRTALRSQVFCCCIWTSSAFEVVLRTWSTNNCLFYFTSLRNVSSCACDSAHGKEMFMLTWSIISSFPPGSTHSFRHSGCIWMWLCAFPRATLPSPDNVSGGGGPAAEHLIMDHHVEGSPGGLHVGEYFHGAVFPQGLKLLT